MVLLPPNENTMSQLRPWLALAQMFPKTSTSVSRVKFGSKKHVVIFPAANSYAVANTQFASEWGRIDHCWLKMALFESVVAV